MEDGQDIARAVITLVSFLAFIGIVIWAYSSRRKTSFDEAANLPFDDDDVQRATLEAERKRDDTQPNHNTDTTAGERR